MVNWEKQLEIALYSSNPQKLYDGSLTESDKDLLQPNFDFQIDAMQLFKFSTRLHQVYNNTEDRYIIANSLDFGIVYGGDKLAVNFIFAILRMFKLRFTNELLLLARLRLASVKLLILRVLHHLQYLHEFKPKKYRHYWRKHWLDILYEETNDETFKQLRTQRGFRNV